jgi:glycosyltransferase involved in cell wall biosynthesis
MERILFVANDFPYPPNHGDAVHTWSLIQGLKQLGFALDLIATVKASPKQEDLNVVRGIVEHLFIIERNRSISAALSSTPFQVRSREALRSIALSETYDVVLLKSDYVAPILANPHVNAKVRVLVADGEARYFRALSKCANSWWERCFYRAEALKFDRFSPRFRSKCDLLWFVSDWERTLHVREHPEDSVKSVFLPPDPGVEKMYPYSEDGTEALFIGSLTIPLNLEGLEWYVEYIHPRLSVIPGYSLTVAGRTGGTPSRALNKIIGRYPNISLCADPRELSVLYKRAAVFVNPVLRGAGIKLKTINALQSGVPVVSTSIGIEGTGLIDGKHLLVADSCDDFVSSVATLLRDKSLAGRLVDSAQSFLAETYDSKRNIRSSLSSVLPVHCESASRGIEKEKAADSACRPRGNERRARG